MRGRIRPLFVMVAALVATACSPNAPSTPTPVKLAPVAPLPRPSLPAWIAAISPTARAQSLAQIRVIFAKPVSPVESLEGDGPRNVLSHFTIEPALRGRFVLFTPKMVGFVAEEALPVATRVRVTLTKGLADLAGDRLESDVAWTFETAPLAFTDLPNAQPSPDESTPQPYPLRPRIAVSVNAPVDPSSLSEHATLVAGDRRIAVRATLEPTPTPVASQPPNPDEAFGAGDRTWTYDLEPQTDLDRATRYALTIDPGVEPARGNIASVNRFSGSIRTFDAFVVTPTAKPSAGDLNGSRFAQGDPVIALSNPIDPKTLKGNVTVSPAVVPSPSVIVQNDSQIAIDPYALSPNTNYTVTLGSGLKDVFGQTLASHAPVAIHTSDFAPGMWAPSGSTLIPANAGVNVNLYATNLPENRYRAAFTAVSPMDVLLGTGADRLLGASAKNWPLQTIDGAKTNEQSVVRVKVQDRLHGDYGTLAYGFWSPVLGSQSSALTGTVQLTNLGVFAQFFPASARIMVEHLDDGSNVGGASVTVYRMPGQDGSAPAQCAQGTTGADGSLAFSGIDIERCYINAPSDGMPDLGVVVADGADSASVRVFDYSGIYRFDVPGGWASGAPVGTGTIFPDRDMYQPGEHGVFTGIAYYTQEGAVRADPRARYRVVLEDPSGAKTQLPDVTTDAFGTFSEPYTFGPAAPLGYYSITATGDRGDKIVGGFRVAEFKPPNFKVDVSLDKSSATAGASVRAAADAQYLFGAPLAGAKANVYVTRSYATLAPKGWDEYSFGRQWFWPEQQPALTTDVLQQQQTLDSKGTTSLAFTLPTDLPAPLTYNVEFDATDASNLSVSNSKTLLALPQDGIIGLASDTVGPARAGMPIRVIVTQPDGTPIVGRAVHLELQKMTYVWASQAQEGGEAAQDSIKYDTVDRTDVTSGSAPVTATLTPNASGSYRVRATFTGAQGNAGATDLQVFAYGSNAADFGAQDTSSVRVTLDKKSYKVGDTATALIGSPFDRADVYVAVIRYGTIYQTILHNVTGAPRVSFKVTPAMFPNAAVEAVVVRRGTKLAQVKPGTLDSLARTGMAAFTIDLHDRYLKLDVSPAQQYLEPGTAQRVAFHLRDAQNRPVRGKIIAMAVNDAILQLSGYRLPDLVSTIYAPLSISTRFADNRENITLQTPQAPVEKGFGFGGGFLEGAAGTRVRTNFLPLAFYGAVTTDAAGVANVSFKLPDDLTTWRVMAVAIGDGNDRFGTSDATFVSRLPVMANPLLPQFARTGDRFDIGASIMNQTGASGSLDLLVRLNGALHFAQGNPSSTEVTQAIAPGMQAFRMPVVAGTPAPASVAVNASVDGKRDAFSVPFTVENRSISETVIDAGAAKGTVQIPIGTKLDSAGTMSLLLANSIVPQLSMQASRALDQEPLQTANDLGARVIIGAAIGAKNVAADVGGLLKLQRDDGGFRYYTGDRASDPTASAYALEALAYARDHHIAVDRAAVSRAASYASAMIADPNRTGWCDDALCKAQTRFSMLWALASNGDRRSDFLETIYAQRDRFDDATQLRLARYLLATPAWHARGVELAQRLEQRLYVTGRYATVNLSDRWAWRDSIVDAQAQMLQLLLDRNAPLDQLDGAARSLIEQKCRCGWPSTQSAASAVSALTAYGARVPPEPMHVAVSSGGAAIGSRDFGTASGSATISVPIAAVQSGSLTLKANRGTLHYVLSYTYPLPSDAPGNVTAFRVTRQLFEAGSTHAFATIDLASPASPVATTVGQVFDVGLR
ncbi:MAG TPA: Ig-like domain-containing protein, partial [Candidatus Aquilonibacter sp.]|nr:Ig-like domain-containing protein [Candidatus Aquilonibacter sp.]